MGSTSYLSSPDEVSPYYPERFIRPLPKRTIRSRLSAEAADSIAYPPTLASASLPAYSHYGEDDELLQEIAALTDHQDYEHEHDSYHEDDEHDESCPHHGHHHHHCHHDDDEDDLDSVENESPLASHHPNTRSSPKSPRSQRHARYNSYNGKSSSASAPDGYEAFENTNNKKKRKIPTSGSMSIHQGSLDSDFAHMGLSGDGAADELDLNQSYATSPSGLGVSGAGRSQRGRRSSARNPLGVSTNGSNMRPINPKYDQTVATTGSGDKADQGIISKAIANATTLLRNPLGKGQENVGVLDQQAKTTPTNSQFTFTCESDAKGVKFPEQSLYSPDYATRVNSAPAAAPSQPQKYPTQDAQYAQQPQQVPPPQQNMNHVPPPTQNQKQRPRRRKGDVYALAARQRKLQQEYQNLQNPPSHEDIWICEFCEYESIFGSQPHALVRQYEIKDRKERKRLAEKRRLLEKAKLKGRKGKKQTKNAAKAANSAAAAQQPINNNQENYDNQPLDQVDDYFDEGYDDDPIPMPAPPPQTPAKQAMPGSYAGAGGGGSRKTSTGSAGVAGGGTTGGGTIR